MPISDSLRNFLNKYFINPIYSEPDLGYNFINTITYAILALVILYLIYIYILKPSKIQINSKFFLSLTPFIFLGSLTRALVDHKYIKLGFWTVAPGIYFLMTFLFLTTLLFSLLLDKYTKTEYWQPSFIIGFIINIFIIAFYASGLVFRNLNGLAMILGLFFAILVSLYFVFKKLNLTWATKRLSMIAISSHLLDASATSIFTSFFGGVEKHPLPRLFIEFTGTGFSFLPLKLLIIIATVYILYKEIEDKELRNYLLIAVAILGLGEGLRDILTLIIS